MERTDQSTMGGSVLEDGALSGLISFLLAVILPVYVMVNGTASGFWIVYMIMTPFFWILSGVIGGYVCHRHGWAVHGQHSQTGAIAGGITGLVTGILSALLIQVEGVTILNGDNMWLIGVGCAALPVGLGAVTGALIGRITGAVLRTPKHSLSDPEEHKLLDDFSKRWIDRHIIKIAFIGVLILYALYKLVFP